jgi:hypothetical protein
VVVLVTLAVAAVLVASAAAALPGKPVARKSVSGSFAVTALNATVKTPKRLWVRFTGRVTSATVVVACSRGFSISSNPYSYRKAGLYRLPIKPPRAESCDLVASVGGSGRVTVEIRAVR